MDVTGLEGGAALADVDTMGDAMGGAVGGAAGDVREIEVGYGGSLTSDVAMFADSLGEAAARLSATSLSPVAEVVLAPLGAIDREAAAIGAEAQAAMVSGEPMTPAEIVNLTMRSQEFMFHSQLTANVANRTADGLQQLFRQQG